MTLVFAGPAPAAKADHSGPFVQVSNYVPGRNVKIANHSNETETPNPFYEFVDPGHFSSRGALAFYVRAGERVGYRSLVTGVNYISRCGSVGGSWESIGNSVLLTNYIVRQC